VSDPGKKPEVVVFPVPRGYTPEQAWAEISVYGQLVDYRWWRPRYHWPFVRWAIHTDDPEEDT
jgi:hypothetical protein